MRKQLFAVLSATLMCVTSCYKDLSTEATQTIPDIKITAEDISDTIKIKYLDSLIIVPEIVKGDRKENDFDYLWEIDLMAEDKDDRLDIGDGSKNLRYQVANSPAQKPYTLSLTVTDKIDGMGRIKKWTVYVSSSFNEGLAVAYTRDGGATFDVDLASNKAITYGYTSSKPTYVRNVYSAQNKDFLQGRANAIIYQAASNGATFNEDNVLICTNEHIFRIDPLNFKIRKYDSDLYNQYLEPTYGGQNLWHLAYYGTIQNVNGTMYYCMDLIDNRFSKIMFSPYLTEKNIACTPENQGRMGIFDPASGKFYGALGAIFQGSAPSQVSNPPVNYSLVGCEAIAAGPSKDLMSSFIIKDSAGVYHLTMFDMYYPASGASYTLEAPEIDKAVTFATCDNCTCLYYSTPDQAYAIVASGSAAVVRKLNFTPDSKDEKITMIKQYMQGWWGTRQLSDYDFALDTNRKQLLIVTYNEKTGEGKVYLRPFNVSTGMLTMTSNGTLSGFGEITAITATF